MRIANWIPISVLAWVGVATTHAASPAAVLSGVVVDDAGAPMANALVLYRTTPNIVTGPDGRRIPAGPLLGASVKTGSDGSFTVTGLPAATYHLCAYGTKDTHLGSCEWQRTTVVDLAAGQTVQLRFQIAEGTMLTFQVEDPRQQIRDLADLYTANGKLPLGGQNFGIGVWAGSRYALAKLVSKNGVMRRYQLAIPKTATVRVFLDTSLNVEWPGGALPTRVPSVALAAANQAEVVTNLTVR